MQRSLLDILSIFQDYSSDLYADKNSVPSTPELVQRKSTFTHSEKKDESKVVKTTIVEHSYEFQGASARDIYEALLDSKRADIWTRSKSKVSKRIGTDFEFFDGNVHGVLLQAVKVALLEYPVNV
jgi:activator of HSP90 ATPase